MQGARHPGVCVQTPSAAGRTAGVQTGAEEGPSVGTRGHPEAGRGRPEAQERCGGLSPVLRVPAGHMPTAGMSRAWPGAPTQGQVGAASTMRVSWSFWREERGAAQVGPWLAPDLVKLEPQQLQARLLARTA